MTAPGLVHVVCAALSLGLAGFILLRPKGTPEHVRAGHAYVGLLVLLNASALLVPTDEIGPFHVLALVSVATLAAGLLLSPRRRGGRVPHAILMVWSVAGVVAAGLAQGATAGIPHAAPWPVILPTGLVTAVTALITVRMVRQLR